MKYLIAMFTIGAFSSISQGSVTVKFPEKELATESVLPLFDNAEAVKSRLVKTAGRLELGLDLGWAMNEPFFKTQRFGGHLGYNFNEIHGLTLIGQFYSNGLNQNGVAIYNPADRIFIRMDHAPQNKYNVFLNYQVTPYYGKISVTKGFVMNLSLYGYAGLGVVGIGETNTENSLAANIGVGQKFYITKNFGIRADMDLLSIMRRTTSKRIRPYLMIQIKRMMTSWERFLFQNSKKLQISICSYLYRQFCFCKKMSLMYRT